MTNRRESECAGALGLAIQRVRGCVPFDIDGRTAPLAVTGTRRAATGAGRGYGWTAMGAINAIPRVCEAPPGWVTHLDLGLVQPQGLVRK